MKRKKMITALMMAVVFGICSQSGGTFVHAESQEQEYEEVKDLNQLLQLTDKKYQKYEDSYCLYALRVPRKFANDEEKEDQLVLKVIYTNYDGNLREESVAAEESYCDIKPEYSNITGDRSNDYLWVPDTGYYSTESVLKIVEEEVGPLEEMNYFEPVILVNSFEEDLVSDRYDTTLDSVEFDKDSAVMTLGSDCLGTITSFDEFIENLGHSLVYWNDSSKHDKTLEISPEDEDISYRIYMEKVKVANTTAGADNEMVIYVSWDCPGMKETYCMAVYAPQDYFVPVKQELHGTSFDGLSCSYLETFAYNGAEHGDIDHMVWFTYYWDTQELLPLIAELYDGDLDELAYFEPAQVYEGVFEAGTYHDPDLHPAEWED